MRKATKVGLVTATSFVLIGCILFVGVMTVLKWDFTKLQTVKFETNEYTVKEVYQNLSIVTDTADIAILPSQNVTHRVVCYEQQKVKHAVSVEDGTLKIEVQDTRKWYEYIGIVCETPTITVHIPAGEYGALSITSGTGNIEISKDFTFQCVDVAESTGNVAVRASALDEMRIRTTTGNICLENASVGSLDLSVTTGKIAVSHVTCKRDANVAVSTGKTSVTDMQCQNLISSGSTGSISLNAVIAAETFTIQRSTGNVHFEGADAAEIFVQTDTGDVEGNLLTDKIFLVETDTGRVDVPKSVTGGKCEIHTDTGNIILKTAERG